MRKFIFLAVLLNTVFLAQGQGNGPDTIVGRNPNYFYDFWPPDEWIQTDEDDGHRALLITREFANSDYHQRCVPEDSTGFYMGYGDGIDIQLQRKSTPKPIKVLGLAIVLTQHHQISSYGGYQYHDDYRYEDSLLLYEVDDTGALVYMNGVRLSYSDTVAHLMRFNYAFPDNDPEKCSELVVHYDTTYLDVYDYYFDTPSIVNDDFYIGHTTRSNLFRLDVYERFMGDSINYSWPHWTNEKLVPGFHSLHPDILSCEVWDLQHYRYSNLYHNYWWECDLPEVLMMWPIIEVGWVDAEHPEQSEGAKVYPNPAGDRVTVESEEEIVRVWVTDELGRMVYDHDHHSPKVYLNVAPWPNGMYVVHFQTATAPIIYTSKLMVTH